MQTVMKAAQYLLHLANSFAEYCEISPLKLGRPFFLSQLKGLVVWLDAQNMTWNTDDILIGTDLSFHIISNIVIKETKLNCNYGVWMLAPIIQLNLLNTSFTLDNTYLCSVITNTVL